MSVRYLVVIAGFFDSLTMAAYWGLFVGVLMIIEENSEDFGIRKKAPEKASGVDATTSDHEQR